MSETAKDLAKQLLAKYGTLEDLPYGEEIRDELISEIAAALVAHANAALEAAAKVADAVYEREHNALPDTRIDGQWIAKHLAAAIRALKSEEE